MKKIGVFVVFLLLTLSFVLAQSNSSTNSLPIVEDEGKVSKAYQCLEDRIEETTAAQLSLQEAIFSTLALGSQKKLTDKIESEKGSNCWPKSACNLKDTAQVLLAYDRIGKNTADIEKYLISKNGTATDLNWYLILDITNHVPSSCTIKYGSSTNSISVGNDMKISGNPGSCLSITQAGFWLSISNSCFDREFQISCDQDFVTTLIYQKSGSETYFVSSETHSAASSGTTTEKINARCFKAGGVCDYEGSLWTALALQKSGYEVSSYIPYLQALAPENEKLFPASFLYLLTNAEDQYSSIVQSQISSKYWQAPNSRYNKFYDTALGMMSLQSSSATELSNAKSYLLGIQTPKGCWNNDNIRDTAFLLYAGWPRAGSGSGTGTSGAESCEAAGFFCESVIACTDAGGELLNNYECTGFGKQCCSVDSRPLSCSEQNGVICSSSQRCSGTSVPSLESGECCLDSCEAAPQENLCEASGGICSLSCQDGEQQTSDSCTTSDQVCCVPETTTSSGSSNVWLWIIILIILIALVALAIVYRNRLKLWWFKFRNRGAVKSSPTTPRGPPSSPAYRPTSTFPQRRPVQPVRKRDTEMDDILKKLKDIGK